MNILLVEPDKILGSVIKAAFEAVGDDVVWTRSAQIALDSLDDTLANQPDIIILEIQLGLHNGIEFLYEIRSYPEWQHIPVIVHTINENSKDNIFSPALKQLGVVQVFYKPQTPTASLVKAARRLVPAL